MHSPRTERLRQAVRIHPLRRLDTRFVVTISAVALIGLVISGVAISQILPGYFVEQANQRLRSAANATYRLLEDEVTQLLASRPGLLTPDVRGTRVYQPVVQRAADDLVLATVEVWEGQQLMARATPQDVADLEAQGLAPDPAVSVVRVGDPQGMPMPAPELNAPVSIVVRDPYTSRVQTLERVGFALLAGGVVAFVVALLAGAWAASRLTRPLARLREASVRIADGHLAERVPPAEIAEVDALGSQFNAMADQLEQTLSVISADRDRLRAFIADVSHELRTPIAALRTFTDLQRDGEVDEATRREFLDRSSEQISRLEWMSSNLLDLSRIDAGIFPLDIRDGDLRDPLRSVVEAHAEIAETRGVSLSSEVPATAVTLPFDRERIVQLVSNLVGNALKFTPPGGAVVIVLTDADDEAVIEVRDTGPGIPAAELPQIFERFYRGTNTGDARASGSGLGLAIARSIVEMHGGELAVQSVAGEGATFRVSLPRRSVPAPPPARPAAAAVSVTGARAVGAPGEDQ
ncbi:MAG TPA: HAMP domain-containing sensor histidine kinase [Candidatus Limnocylindria bacterium]|nr:HAMP domain-containing sensor histidine kinase [Candidatus Limnocylindria bacterium]